jgi:hypothetical protein
LPQANRDFLETSSALICYCENIRLCLLENGLVTFLIINA